jgi:hypothetical protein
VPHTAFPKANSRRLLLPTGMALVVESDSEEEHEQTTQMNAPRNLSAVTVTGNVSCCKHQHKILNNHKAVDVVVNETVVTS